MPTANKIELFARNNNLRPGWLSLGNQLGEKYLKDLNPIFCNFIETVEKTKITKKSLIIANSPLRQLIFWNIILDHRNVENACFNYFNRWIRNRNMFALSSVIRFGRF